MALGTQQALNKCSKVNMLHYRDSVAPRSLCPAPRKVRHAAGLRGV